jgi:hypothetical protein
MARTVRLELRVTPELAEAIKRARGLVPLSTWLEAAAIEKVGRDGQAVPVQANQPDGGPAAPIPPAEHTWPRRPPPRLSGGRRNR